MEIDIDLYSPETIQDPWDRVRELQDAGPVLRNVRTGAWMVTTDRLARQVLTDTSRFRVENTPISERFGSEAFFAIDDKPRHDLLRGIWMNAFTRNAIEGLRAKVGELADTMLDPAEERLRAGETVDMEKAICRDLPAYVIAHFMGIPDRYRPDIVRWSDALGAASVLPANLQNTQNETWNAALRARDEIGEYLMEAIEYRRRNPGTDLISQIVHSPHNLPDDVIVANTRQMLYAGNETTAKWLGHILVALDEFRDVRQVLIEDRSLVPQGVEEVMRWRPVVMASVRRVQPGVEVEGIEIPEGAVISPMVCCANRDAARYEAPESFNIRRKYLPHLGFGFGMHSCLGITLARLEADVVINRILSRIPDYEIAGEVTYNAFTLRGPKTLPVALH